jgi:putative DNA primase/helicase
MSWSNYDDVLGQLRSAGLHVERLEIGSPRAIRCLVEGGGREKRGWYMLHELHVDSGDLLIVGSYGVWRGNDNGAQKVALRKSDRLSRDQVDAMRRRLAEDRKRLQAQRDREAASAARRAGAAWARLSPNGESDYLAGKGVSAHGLRFTDNGSAVLPLLDGAGKIHGLQFLRSAKQAEQSGRPAKEFWPAGLVKKGHFHLIGAPQHLVLVAEGYATAATLHEATGYPVAVAFDAGNLAPVAAALRKRYRRARVLVCADDDILGKCQARDESGKRCGARVVLAIHPTDCPECSQPHGYVNAGVTAASATALEVSGAWVAPRFADPNGRHTAYLAKGSKPTDFNDLHQAEGLHVVRTQIEARLSDLEWQAPKPRAAAPPTQGGGERAKLRPVEDAEELIRRFALIYAHSSAAFDRQEHRIVSLSDMRDLCLRKDLHRAWVESPRRDIVRIDEVGFDPTEKDPGITCNLFGGWPTVPKAGSCDKLLELLFRMCAGDGNAADLYKWVLKWIAYPIQHPGAKMKTTLVLHGPQGTGKNLFFEALMRIYGEYGDVIDQSAVEDKFNDWASRKLFMIADEVVARSDLYHVKNKLKGLITGDRILINPKGFTSHWERNHLNLVFLSNEAMPVVIEEDDRRHCVIWTPPPDNPGFYAEVAAEVAAGGVAALHDYLLHLNLGDFGPHAKPPHTAAKVELVNLGLDSPMRFLDELVAGDVVGLDPMPGLTTDWYAAYRHWCNGTGVKAAPLSRFVNALGRKRGVLSGRKAYRTSTGRKMGPHGFLLIEGQGDGGLSASPPEGKGEMDHLGHCMARCHDQVESYRGALKS